MLAPILLVAALLRVWGIGFGLPYQYHVDEPQYIVQAAQMLDARSLRPAWFNNPPLAKYTIMAAFIGVYGIGALMGEYESPADFAEKVTKDHSVLYLAGRLLSVLYGALTVLAVYVLGCRGYGARVGGMATLLIAVAFIHVRESHFATNDVLFTLWATLIALVSVLALRKRSWVLDVGGGVLVGLSLATKYTGVLFFAPLIVAFALWAIETGSSYRHSAARLITVVLAAIGSAVVVSPYFVIDPGAIVADIQEFLVSPSSSGQFYGWVLDARGGYVYYVTALGIGLGWLLVSISFVAVVHAFVSRNQVSVVLSTIPVTFFLALGSQEMFFSRFILPAVPCLMVLIAHTVDVGASRIRLGWEPTRQGQLAWIIVGVVMLPTLTTSLLYDRLMTMVDTRTLAKEWIEEHVPDGAVVAVDWPVHGPPMSTAEDRQPRSLRQYNVITAGGLGLSAWPLAEYCRRHVQYAVLSSSISSIPIHDPSLESRRLEALKQFDNAMDLQYHISPYRIGMPAGFVVDRLYGPWDQLLLNVVRPGPALWVYRVKHCADPQTSGSAEVTPILFQHSLVQILWLLAPRLLPPTS